MSTAAPAAPTSRLLPTDEERRRGLRRMKSVAGGLLVLAAIVYVVARRAEEAGAPAWVGFVRAAAEAGMIGGLADWFAVTALFRRPLGLPIPHTALIPSRKDALGESLGDFVGGNFLAEEVVRSRVRQAGVSGRVGAWISQEPNAERVAAEVAVAIGGALEVLRDPWDRRSVSCSAGWSTTGRTTAWSTSRSTRPAGGSRPTAALWSRS
jgi:uncharacterized membrane-anchored protein YjiN (DUF445 family)